MFDIYPFRNPSPSYLGSMRDEIDMDPVYQRQGEVWPISKRRLLIDSILNDFDLPKIYIHELAEPRSVAGRTIRYALVDGKQRLGAIFGFMDGAFTLDDDFVLLRDPSVNAKGLTFRELGERYPVLQSRFISASLPIVVIKTDDTELIEEMFSRLNEAVPLNAPEKRNAFKGPAPAAVRRMVTKPFYLSKLPFSDTRYRHRDMAAKFLLWEDDWAQGHVNQVKDVKKIQLDSFFQDMHRLGAEGKSRVKVAETASAARASSLASTFIDNDPLLASVGMVSIYYILHQDRENGGEAFPARDSLVKFEIARKDELPTEEGHVTRGHLAVFEFNRLTQSPNDASALVYRLHVLDAYTSALQEGKDPLLAVADLAPVETEK